MAEMKCQHTLVCRLWNSSKGEKPPTRVINLARNPATPADAIATAWAIENGTVTSQGLGTVQEVDAAIIEAGNWGAVQFLSPYLCEQFSKLSHGKLFSAVPLGEIATVGPAGQRIREAYRRSHLPDANGRVALWQHDTTVTQSILGRPDTYITAVPKYAHRADRYWEQRSRLLLPTHLNLPTIRATAVRLEAPAVGSLWIPCGINADEDSVAEFEKALCVYLNSAIGLLSILGDRTNKKPTYPNLSLDDLRKLSVPDFAASGDESVKTLVSAYDSLAERTLLPLAQMDKCPARQAIDNAVGIALNVDAERIGTIRRHLAAEPSVTGERYRGHHTN